MTVETRLLVPQALPPLTIPPAAARRIRQGDPMPRLGRILCVLAALALPAFGIAVADMVHRAGEPRASQAAAPVIPSDGAAAPQGAGTPVRALRAVRTANATGTGEVRS
ncbi:hypothetical protein MKK69_27760 [Methylobacterium sp. J-026]|uniref:hypothetical protein n=1 Tax=Methylobacterium sp. J-026 TaxID=2836624 RepID=UPI001FB9492F|nr:hypothetical protein [Methylobacterium sp. J-026]MCJ2137795.1 hypothetical protein [Methylobacterium sp. J-026]